MATIDDFLEEMGAVPGAGADFTAATYDALLAGSLEEASETTGFDYDVIGWVRSGLVSKETWCGFDVGTMFAERRRSQAEDRLRRDFEKSKRPTDSRRMSIVHAWEEGVDEATLLAVTDLDLMTLRSQIREDVYREGVSDGASERW